MAAAKKKGKKDAPPAEEAAVQNETKPEEDLGEMMEGHFLFPDNSSYDGQYLKKGEDVCLHGKGRLVSGPETFDGEFERGGYKRGTYTSPNGAVYVGNFRHNQFHGFGEYTWPDPGTTPRMYKGMWRDGVMHGRGRFRNFTFGTDTVFEGFAYRGSFASTRETQDVAKRNFLEEYGAEYTRSATEALQTLAQKAEAAGGVAKDFLIPSAPAQGEAEETPSVLGDREAAEEVFGGIFPDKDAVVPAALGTLAATFTAEAERPGRVVVVEEAEQDARYAGAKLKRTQLEHIGQAIEMHAPDGVEPGQIAFLVLGNVSQKYDAAEAKWKLIHCEIVPAPA